MRFDLKHGLDTEAKAWVAAKLPPGADVDDVIAKLETAGRYYDAIKDRPREAAAERDRYAKMLDWTEKLTSELRAERRRHGPDNWTRPIRDQLRVAHRQISARLHVWKARAHFSRGRADPDVDLFYFQIIEPYRGVGGKVTAAHTAPGNAAVEFFQTVAAWLGHNLSEEGARKVVRRFARDYTRTAKRIEQYQRKRNDRPPVMS